MLRILLSTLFVVALAAGPAALPAQDPGIEATGTAASCELTSCGERGPASDPDGIAVASLIRALPVPHRAFLPA